VVRLNFSHGDRRAPGAARAAAVRAAAARLGREVGILADLPGPEDPHRALRRRQGALKAGERFDLDCRADAPPGRRTQVGVSYLGLPGDVAPGDVLLLDDGLMQLQVERGGGRAHRHHRAHRRPLSDRKGLNKLGGGLSLGALTDATAS
jgi:pyruvate kinase